MKILIIPALFFVALVCPRASQGATWNKIAQINGMGRVSACYFFNESTGIIGFDQVSNGSPLMRTTDGGMTWQPVSTPLITVDWTCDIWFKDSLEGWATFLDPQTRGHLWHSTDGGLSWSSNGLVDYCTGVRSTSKTLVVTMYDGNPGLRISTDDGNTFSSSYGTDYNGIDYVDSVHGAVTEYNGSVFAYTSDGGLSWRDANSPAVETWGVCGIPGTGIFLASSEGAEEILRSTDYGATWNITASSLSLNGSIFEAGGIICAQTIIDGVLQSFDTGKTWTNIGGPSNGKDCRIAAFPCVIYAFDDQGGIWKYSNGNGQVLALNTTTRNFGTISPCQTHDTIISFTNTECTSISLNNSSLSGPGGIYTLTSAHSGPYTLAPGDSTSVVVSFAGSQPGTFLDTIVLSFDVGTWRIPVQATIRPIDSIHLLDFGTFTSCQPHDTTFLFTNTECNSIVIQQWSVPNTDTLYAVAMQSRLPDTLAPGESISLGISFNGSEPGTFLDTIALSMDVGTWTIPIQTTIRPADSIHFVLQTVATVSPNQQVEVDVVPTSDVVSSSGLTTLSGRLSFLVNDFGLDSLTSAIPEIPFKKNGPFQAGNMDFLDFSLSNPTGISLVKNAPIAKLWLHAMLTDSINYSIQFDSVLLNEGDPAFSSCTLATTSTQVTPIFKPLCGDRIIMQGLTGKILFEAGGFVPNPFLADADGNPAQIAVESYSDGIAELKITNGLGEFVFEQQFNLHAGEPSTIPVAVGHLQSGSYFYTIRFLSPLGQVAKTGSFLVLQ